MTLRDPLAGLHILERGWLSSNNILILPASADEGAVVVDSGHAVHAQQTVDLLKHALGEVRLDHVVNTHLHSDHCGGNAALQAAFGAQVSVAPAMAAVVNDWRSDRLTYESTGQICPRFVADQAITLSGTWRAGGRTWEILEAPGHDPDSLMLLDREAGVLLSADALWGNGFGVVFPELDDCAAFDDVQAVLDLIAALPVRVVVPGHGAPFTDVEAALERAYSRLAAFRADPTRHARHAAKVLISYHLMERGGEHADRLLDWALNTPLMQKAAAQAGAKAPASHRDWVVAQLEDLRRAGGMAADEAGVWRAS